MAKRFKYIIPSELIDDGLSFNAGALYAIIYSLGHDGECFASNKYFSERLGVSERAIQQWLEQLEAAGWIRREVNGNRRRIFPQDPYSQSPEDFESPGARTTVHPSTNHRSPEDEQDFTLARTTVHPPYIPTRTVTSTVDKNSNNLVETQAEPKKKVEKLKPKVIDLGGRKDKPVDFTRDPDFANHEPEFTAFWETYPEHRTRSTYGKRKAWNCWQGIKDQPETIEAIFEALEWQVKSEDWTKEGGKYVPNPDNYLRYERWLDRKPDKQVQADAYLWRLEEAEDQDQDEELSAGAFADELIRRMDVAAENKRKAAAE